MAKKATNPKTKSSKSNGKKKTGKAASAKSGALAKREVNAIVKSNVPDYIKSEEAELNIEPGELQIPFIKLLQSKSEQVNCESPIGVAGEFFNTAIEEAIGTEVYFIPVLLNRKRIMWHDYNDGGGMDCRSYDNKKGSVFGLCSECIDTETGIFRSQFGPNGEKPVCTKYYDFVSVIFPEKPAIDQATKIVQSIEDFSTGALSVIGFGVTKIPAARHLIKIAQAKKAALYANVFKMIRKFSEKAECYVPEIAWYGWVDPDIYMAISDDIESLKTLAGNPESYTKAEEENEIREQAADTEEGKHYVPSKDDDEDLPF